jgi:hypothetical protein
MIAPLIMTRVKQAGLNAREHIGSRRGIPLRPITRRAGGGQVLSVIWA